ncbi:uncharacterized protein TNCV_14811 [Trichonephila clavipes]|nr:uncharacterized protein TNCV_14811 [Trichonephila clavipes]
MGTRLRRLKTKMRGQKLSDGKPLCGRNRLTEAEIDLLQAYYGLAIRRNLSSVKDMQQAIWAIFLHKLSTDEKPQHGFCPSDSDTWCKFKNAELLGETYHHKNSLPVDVVEVMRPVFRDLANPELLKKCLHGGTQNPNESVNNVIWSRVPKKIFVQLEVLSLVSVTNRGCKVQLDGWKWESQAKDVSIDFGIQKFCVQRPVPGRTTSCRRPKHEGEETTVPQTTFKHQEEEESLHKMMSY